MIDFNQRAREVLRIFSGYGGYEDGVRVLASALERVAAEALEEGWQPIETAPRDGTMILVTNENYAYTIQRCQIVRWGGVIWSSEGSPNTVGWHNQSSGEEDPPETWYTHWRPLPNPPRQLIKEPKL